MFLGGLIMFTTGICLILNYDVFDDAVFPPEMQTEDGKRTLGIILTVCGLLAIFVSVLVSALYLCNKQKPGQVNPNELSQIPSARNGTPDGRLPARRNLDNRSPVPSLSGTLPSQRGKGVIKPIARPAQQIPGSAEVKHPRYKKRHRHKQKFRQSRLEEIKESDAVSRKTLEGAVLALDETMSPRSGSFSSEMTLEDSRNPRIVLNHEHVSDDRRASDESASTSMTSDTSNYRTLEHDKSRRELQFIPDAKAKDEHNKFETSSKDSQDEFSLIAAYQNTLANGNVHNKELNPSIVSDDQYSAGGNSELSQQRDSSASNSQVLPDSDGTASLSSYRPQLDDDKLRAKIDAHMTSETNGIVNGAFEDEEDIHIPGQSDVTSEEGDDLTKRDIYVW